MNRSTRREFIRLFGVSSLGLLLAACGYPPATPTRLLVADEPTSPQSPVPTDTPVPSSTATAMPTSTDTPTPTSTSTIPPTATPTITPTVTRLPPTVTLRPTGIPTAVGQIIFMDDFENGFHTVEYGGWYNMHQDGGSVDFVPDPLGTGTGIVMRCVTNTQPTYRANTGMWWHFLFPSYKGPEGHLRAPFSVELEMCVPNPSLYMAPFGMHMYDDQGTVTNVAGFEMRASNEVVILVHDSSSAQRIKTGVVAPRGYFTLGMVNTPDKMVTFSLNGQTLGTLNAKSADAYDIHPGFEFASSSVQDGVPAGYTVLDSKFTVRQLT